MHRIALAALLLASAGCGPQPAPPPAGPDATLTAADGKTVKLSDYRGKKSLVLLFMRGFTGDFACFHCGKQTKAYTIDYEAVKAAGGEVLAILPGATDVKGFLEKVGTADPKHPDPGFGVLFPVLLDSDFSACRTFGVTFDVEGQPFPVSEPATIVIGRDGAIVYAYHGKNPGDRPKPAVILEVLKTGKAPRTEPVEKPVVPAASAIAWTAYDDGMKLAKEQKKPVLLEFYADW